MRTFLYASSLSVLFLSPPTFGKRLLLEDSSPADLTNTTDVNLAVEGTFDTALKDHRRRRRRRDRRRVSDQDRHGTPCRDVGMNNEPTYCVTNLDKTCPDCGKHGTKIQYCCCKTTNYPRGHGCYRSPDYNTMWNSITSCSAPFCPTLSGNWTRTKSGETTSIIALWTSQCYLQWGPPFPWPSIEDRDEQGWAWYELNGGYAWVYREAGDALDKGRMEGNPVNKITWEKTGAVWTLGATLFGVPDYWGGPAQGLE